MAIIDCNKKIFIEAAEFYAEKLGLPKDILIAIRTKKKLKGQYGYCERLISTEEDPFEAYLIVLEDRGKDSDEDPLTILAHEMVHVKQYVKGELQDFAGYSMWKSQRFEDFSAGSEEYYFAPWEVEAYGLQVGLFQMFMRKKYVVH